MKPLPLNNSFHCPPEVIVPPNILPIESPAPLHQLQQQPVPVPSFPFPPQFTMQQLPPMLPQIMQFTQPWLPLAPETVQTPTPPPVPGPISNIPIMPDLFRMDPNILALAQNWSEHISLEGRVYYYNMRTGESSWTKPAVLVQFEGVVSIFNKNYK